MKCANMGLMYPCFEFVENLLKLRYELLSSITPMETNRD